MTSDGVDAPRASAPDATQRLSSNRTEAGADDVRVLDAGYYSLEQLDTIARLLQPLDLSSAVWAAISDGAAFVQSLTESDAHVYGVNTGFGSLCETKVDRRAVERLQYNHVISHASGVGNWAPEHICRLTLLIKLLTFRSGRTGISRQPVERLLDLWNRGLVPAIPQKGSVGASGDLAPLAHMALPILGKGDLFLDGQACSAAPVLQELGINPVVLGPKEGLALTNGVQYINAWGVAALVRLRRLVALADVVAAMSAQAFSAARAFFHPTYHQTSLHPERGQVADRLGTLLAGGNHADLPTSNRSQQDPYSFRCIPQVHGAARQAIDFAATLVERECNGVSDNPLFFAEDRLALFGGNLHGASTALALDVAAIGATDLASISERRTYQLLSGQRGLPSYLIEDPGLNSGLMIVQYTSAALVNECKICATPASVDTIPTSQLQEDHVSMGATSAYKLWTIVENCETVLAIELLTAMQAVDLNAELALSPATREIHAAFRHSVPFLRQDDIMRDHIERSREFLLETLPEFPVVPPQEPVHESSPE